MNYWEKILKPQVEYANQRLLKCYFSTILVVFMIGLVFPADWESSLGFANIPIRWAINNIPSIDKLAAVSPIPDLIRGFFGMAFWLSVASAIYVCAREPLGARLLYAFLRPGTTFVKNFTFLYFVFAPVCAVLIWVSYCLPIMINFGPNKSWGMRMLVAMTQDRFAMAAIGSFAAVTIGMYLMPLAILFIGPLALLKPKGGLNKSDF